MNRTPRGLRAPPVTGLAELSARLAAAEARAEAAEAKKKRLKERGDAFKADYVREADARKSAEAERDGLKQIVETILQADREALADHRPKWGIADCVDNDGVPYQSQFLGEALNRARSLLTTQPGEGDKP